MYEALVGPGVMDRDGATGPHVRRRNSLCGFNAHVPPCLRLRRATSRCDREQCHHRAWATRRSAAHTSVRSAASCSDVPASPGPPSYDDPTLHARDPRVTGPIDGGRAWGDSGALSLAGRSSVAAKTAESAADAALTAGRTSGAAAELRAGGQVFTDVSTGGSPRVLNGAVQDALDAVPLKQQTPWHGACAEMGCLSQALDAGVNPAGGSIRAVAIGSSNPGHGLPKVICSSCANVLDVFGVNH